MYNATSCVALTSSSSLAFWSLGAYSSLRFLWRLPQHYSRQQPLLTIQITPTFDSNRLAQPPTVVPPAQADNGAQVYWGMCMACHGDQGQGLTDEWRNSFPLEERDCWQSGCHGSDAPENSFEIPQTGIPALAGAGKLSRFSNSFELYRSYSTEHAVLSSWLIDLRRSLVADGLYSATERQADGQLHVE